MRKAFVFGKFLPFHKGHEAMIRFAQTHCDFLTILICCSNHENIGSNIRQQWMKDSFRNEKHIEIIVFEYREEELPNTSESSREVSKIWSAAFKKRLPEHTLLITSEPYGEFVAAYMNIQHIAFDIPRHFFPVSGSAIRQNLITQWAFLPDAVKKHFAIKVVLLGTESTGKTTLSEQLSKHYGCSLVMEAGRDLIPDSNAFTENDLYLVAGEHAKRIENCTTGPHPLTIIDTDIHITISYGKMFFGHSINVPADVYELHKSHLYLYLCNDVAHVQDGTRLDEKERNFLDVSHRETLKEYNIGFHEINGDWETRFKKAVSHIDALLQKKLQV